MCKIDLVPDVLNTSAPSPAQPSQLVRQWQLEFSFQICEDQKQYVQRT